MRVGSHHRLSDDPDQADIAVSHVYNHEVGQWANNFITVLKMKYISSVFIFHTLLLLFLHKFGHQILFLENIFQGENINE